MLRYRSLGTDLGIYRIQIGFQHHLWSDVRPQSAPVRIAGCIFDGDTFTSIAIVKGGADKDNPHEVDAVSGGTITSNALALAIQQWLGSYEGFFKLSAEKAKLQETAVQESAPVETNEVESAEN